MDKQLVRLIEITPEQAMFEVNVKDAYEVARHPQWTTEDKYVSVSRGMGGWWHEPSHRVSVIKGDGSQRLSFNTCAIAPYNYENLMTMFSELRSVCAREGFSLDSHSVRPLERIEIYELRGGNEGVGFGGYAIDEFGTKIGLGRFTRTQHSAELAMQEACDIFGVTYDVETLRWHDARRGENRGGWSADVIDDRPPLEERDRRGDEREYICGFTHEDVYVWMHARGISTDPENVAAFEGFLAEWWQDNVRDGETLTLSDIAQSPEAPILALAETERDAR